jgi:hypothetical protein
LWPPGLEQTPARGCGWFERREEGVEGGRGAGDTSYPPGLRMLLPMETVEEKLRDLATSCIQDCQGNPLTNLAW